MITRFEMRQILGILRDGERKETAFLITEEDGSGLHIDGFDRRIHVLVARDHGLRGCVPGGGRQG